MKSKQSMVWGAALGLVFLAHGSVAAQAVPAAEIDPALWAPAPAAATAAVAAAALATASPAPGDQTFKQLSTAPKAAPAAAPGAEEPTDTEAHWLLLAGLAALLFIARRYQRHGEPTGPIPAAAAAPKRAAARRSTFADLRSDPGH